MIVFPLSAANWIRDVAMWPIRPGEGEPDIRRTCRCQWGPCGHCSGGNPQKCAGHTAVGCETYVLNRKRMAIAPVWLSGRPCRWICPGPRRALGTGQLSLFDLEMTNAPRAGLAFPGARRSS